MLASAPSLTIFRRFHILREIITGILLAAVLLPTSYSQSPPSPWVANPSWWTTRGVLAPGRAADDYAVINQGQLKNIVRMAVAEMNIKLTGGAGSALNQMVSSWGGINNGADDFATVNLGQAKAVAAPIYERLLSAGVITILPTWVNATPQASDDNDALANIGQVKSLFSFTLPDQTSIPPEDVEIGNDNLSPFVISYSGWRSAEIHPRLSTDTTELPQESKYRCVVQHYEWTPIANNSPYRPYKQLVTPGTPPVLLSNEEDAIRWTGLRNQEAPKFLVTGTVVENNYSEDEIPGLQTVKEYEGSAEWDGTGTEPALGIGAMLNSWSIVNPFGPYPSAVEQAWVRSQERKYSLKSGSNSWTEASFTNESYFVGGVPAHGVRTTLKGPATAPPNPLQGSREISSWDPVSMLTTLPESQYNDYALPSRGGVVATAIASLYKYSEKYLIAADDVQTSDRYVGEKATGKVKIKWRTDWPSALTIPQKQAWINRYEVTVTTSVNTDNPTVISQPLSNYLTPYTTESGWIQNIELILSLGLQKGGEIKITLVPDPNNPGNPGEPGWPNPVDPENPPPVTNPSFALSYQMPARIADGIQDAWRNPRSLSTGQALEDETDRDFYRIWTGGSVAPNYLFMKPEHDYFGQGSLNLLPKFTSLGYPAFNTYEVSANSSPMVYYSRKARSLPRVARLDSSDTGNPDNIANHNFVFHNERQHLVRIRSSEALPLGHSLTVLPIVAVYPLYHDQNGMPYTPYVVAPAYSALNSHIFTIASEQRESPPVEFGLPPTLAVSENRQASVSLLKVEIKEVSFNVNPLQSDDGRTTYDYPHWVDVNGDGVAKTDTSTGERNYPVAFKRNTKPSVGAKFMITGFPSDQTVKIRAKSAQGLEIPETVVTPTIGGIITLPQTTSLTNLPNSIKFYNADDDTAFKIDWEITVGSGGWAALGSTKHTMYITMNNPIGTATHLMRETLFNLGCRNAMGKDSSEQAVVDAIYEDFKDLDVRQVKPSSGTLSGIKMTYWLEPKLHRFTTHLLLSSGDGKCGAWTRMFIDVLRAQGIDAELIGFYPPEPTISQVEAAISAEYPSNPVTILQYGDGSPSAEAVLLVKNWKIAGKVFAPEDEPGIAAQGVTDPQSYFSDHFVVRYGGKYYDPSYGANVFATQQDWEDAALDAFGVILGTSPPLPDKALTNPPLDPNVTIWVWKTDSKGTQETILRVESY